MKWAIAAVAALALAGGCATGAQVGGGPRPPQGPGPGGTDFGYWDRDAEGAVDMTFRTFISQTYDETDAAKARVTLEKDGFNCRDGNRPDGRPVPELECERVYQKTDDVHAWTVRFWANQKEPESHYTRTHILDRLRSREDAKKPKGKPGG